MCRGRADSPDDFFGELGGGRIFAPSILNSSNGSPNVLPRLARQNAMNGSFAAAVFANAFHETETAGPHFKDLRFGIAGVTTGDPWTRYESAILDRVVDILSLGADVEMVNVMAELVSAHLVPNYTPSGDAAVVVNPYKAMDEPSFALDLDHAVSRRGFSAPPNETAPFVFATRKGDTVENSISAHRPVLGIELLSEVLLGDVVSVDLERHGSVLSTLINATSKVTYKPSSVNPPRVRGVCGTAGRRPGACISSSRVFSYPV